MTKKNCHSAENYIKKCQVLHKLLKMLTNDFYLLSAEIVYVKYKAEANSYIHTYMIKGNPALQQTVFKLSQKFI